MHLSSQVLQDLGGKGREAGRPSRVTVYQTRYGQVAKQVANKRESTPQARNSVTYHVVPTASGQKAIEATAGGARMEKM